METYRKPAIGCRDVFDGLIPAIAPIVGLSAAKLAVVGVAAGLAVGSAKGKTEIDSLHTQILTARKNFALE